MLNLPWDLWFNPLDLPPEVGLETEYDAVSARLQITVVNRGSTPVMPGRVGLTAELESGATGNWAWLHGRYMQTDALVRNFGEEAPEGYDGRFLRESEGRRAYVSREVGTISVLSQQPPILLAGSLRGDRFFFDVEYLLNEEETRIEGLSMRFDLETTELAPGGRLELPPVLFLAGSDARDLIERYADEVAQEMSARVPDHVPTGWCSWYYFYNKVSEADVVANLADMVREKHPAEYVQIDDGFQAHTGDWLTPNAKFPSGMKALADQIRDSRIQARPVARTIRPQRRLRCPA